LQQTLPRPRPTRPSSGGASNEHAIHATLRRLERNERSDIGAVSSNQTPTDASATGNACSSDKCTTIGTTTTAAITLQ
jgi:hypothetical protein